MVRIARSAQYGTSYIVPIGCPKMLARTTCTAVLYLASCITAHLQPGCGQLSRELPNTWQ